MTSMVHWKYIHVQHIASCYKMTNIYHRNRPKQKKKTSPNTNNPYSILKTQTSYGPIVDGPPVIGEPLPLLLTAVKLSEPVIIGKV